MVKNKEFLMELVNNYRLMSVPVLIVKDGDPIEGFNRSDYSKALEL